MAQRLPWSAAPTPGRGTTRGLGRRARSTRRRRRPRVCAAWRGPPATRCRAAATACRTRSHWTPSRGRREHRSSGWRPAWRRRRVRGSGCR
uniref:Uncharacterized protein n=1 Tax=Arundo donax TaxID=35708 RepID=A0A0A9CAG0_ARUDO